MKWTLEVVPVPVSEVDTAIAFYSGKLGFRVDHDTGEGTDRFAQLTPDGSGCSIVVGTSIVDGAPGSVNGLQLVVNDLWKAHQELTDRGVDATPVQVFGRDGQRDAKQGDELDNVGFFYFEDPDGAKWTVQQISSRP